ncbi:hypothetical protein [Catenuloplanes indicus]|uniref:Uncharacterized protein n=1 Tax=Catenuloplanes indicus TaxID=137267 RepID=A0AAE3W038_9ACTN|nr:hypothetical protein [Catenuloplanes indicus]MDQ0366881.1 hypothetical protein [Catenuloplanes indicus]
MAGGHARPSPGRGRRGDLPQVLAGTARRGPLTRGESPAQLLAWRIDDHIEGRTPTPALAAPTEADTARYAALIGLHTQRAGNLDPVEGARTPSALLTDPAIGRTDHQQLLGLVLDEPTVARTLAEPSWPALRTALTRAEYAGYQPADVLAAAVLARPLDTARSVSDVLAWRVARHLHDNAAPATPGGEDGWRQLAWTLKAAEQDGKTAAQLLAGTRPDSGLDDVRRLVHQRTQPAPAHGPLPWMAPIPHQVADDWKPYLDASHRLVSDRAQVLAAAAIADRPAWLAGLGEQPIDPQAARQWQRHVEMVAAFRDEFQVRTDDPLQPLGAYPAADSAAHRAFLHAADAVLATRHPHASTPDVIDVRVTADTYLALPDLEREDVTHAVAGRLGPDWLGPRNGTADTLITTPTYAAHLRVELTHRGHLDPAAAHEPASAEAITTSQPPAHTHVGRGRNGPALPMDQTAAQPGIQVTW